MTANAHGSLYETITNDILAELESGVAPWVKPWNASPGGETFLLPYNALTRRKYRGVNILILWRAAMRKGYRHPAWIGFHQAHELGGHVRKGETATPIVYGSTFVPKDERDKPEEEQQRVPFLKKRIVFNVGQTAGLPEDLSRIPEPVPLPDAIAGVEAFLRTVGAQVRHGGDRAFYSPPFDFIALPNPEAFESAPHYYATSLHEHAHWTGHESRLDRDLSGRFGDPSYAAEELVAELAAAYLCAQLSIPGRLRHAEYLGSWIKLLHDNHRALFTAASKATDAALYLSERGGATVLTEAEEASGEDAP